MEEEVDTVSDEDMLDVWTVLDECENTDAGDRSDCDSQHFELKLECDASDSEDVQVKDNASADVCSEMHLEDQDMPCWTISQM